MNYDELDDELGIKEDLNEKKNHFIKQKLEIVGVIILVLLIIAYIGYTFFYSSNIEEKTDKKQPITVSEKEFELPVKKIEKSEKSVKKKPLPMSPLAPDEEPKKKLSISKSSRKSIISFSTPPKEKKVPNNQVEINLYDKKAPILNAKKEITTSKAPTMYTGGDYAIAGVSRQDPNLSLAKGAYIECTMLTRIVSSYSGNTKCVTSEDIYSTNGVTLLMEKGSTVTGHFKGGNMQNGVDRLFVIWDEIRTPNNVVINIASNSTGQLGATGVDGYVDNHWGMRFGAAVMVSILDIGFEVAKNEYMNNSMRRNRDANISNVNQNYQQSLSPITNMANTALSQFINIKPTFYKNQGDVVGIYVEKDLDFSKVYRLK